MRKNIAVTVILCSLIMILVPADCPAGLSDSGPGVRRWIQDDIGWWYRSPDDSYPVSAWMEIAGEWYYFNEQGYMQTGLTEVDGKFYYLDDDGRMVHDISLQLNGITYDFGPDGACDRAGTYKQPVFIPIDGEKTDLMRSNDAMADQILAGMINNSMTESQKASAIYRWVRANMTYTAAGTVGDWPQAAYEGLRRRRGNCYTFYATSLELLSRAGIPSIEVIRSRDNDHWWNLVYVDGAWYHFDTTPRRMGGDFCLLTTAQLMAYSDAHGGSHMFDQSWYPPTP